MTKVRTQYCYNPEFTVNKVHQVSRAAESLLQWVLNIEAYDRIAKVWQPNLDNCTEIYTTMVLVILI